MATHIDPPVLDEVAKERLRHLMKEQTAVSAGQLVLVGLDAVRNRLGEAWPKYAGRVHEQMIKSLELSLDASEVFLRIDEDRYVIVFHERDQAAARIICEKIVLTVSELFLGTPQLSGLNIDSVVMMLDQETLAHLVGMAEPASIGLQLKELNFEKGASSGYRLVVESDFVAFLSSAVCFVPVWDMVRGTIYTYKPSILSLRGRRRVSGYLALDDARDERAVRLLDFACLEAAGRALGEAAESTVIMTVPVSLRTLSNRDASRVYFNACAGLRDQVKGRIIFELADLNPGTPVWRAYEILSTLKKYSRGIVVRIDKSWRDFSIFRELPIRGLVFDLEMDTRPDARIAEDLKRAGDEARTRGWLFTVAGVYNRAMVGLARAAGARLVYGHYLVAAVSKPLPPAALDWMMMSRLLSAGDAVQLEPRFSGPDPL